MPPPNEASLCGNDIYIERSSTATICPSERLADLLVEGRNKYEWPARKTAAVSQQRIIDLETKACQRITNLDAEKAHWIVREVSIWGGNNAKARRVIDAAAPKQQEEFATLIRGLLTPGRTKQALHALAEQPGIRLVMATKVYRFCSPQAGAAVDRHCAYFFNSLCIREAGRALRSCTQFKREWANSKHRTSRLAVYTSDGQQANLDEYFDVYLPLLRAIADWLNSHEIRYLCAASSEKRRWRPTDVEMAAYQWWSRSGPK